MEDFSKHALVKQYLKQVQALEDDSNKRLSMMNNTLRSALDDQHPEELSTFLQMLHSATLYQQILRQTVALGYFQHKDILIEACRIVLASESAKKEERERSENLEAKKEEREAYESEK